MADLNQLFAGHQTALFNAAAAGSADERQTWGDLVDYYAERIRRMRAAADLSVYRWG